MKSKGESDPGHGDSSGAKTGMGIEVRQAYALLIGVGQSRYSAWSLPVAVRDVLELRKTLADPELCAYPESQIQILRDEAATRAGIFSAIEKLARITVEDSQATVLVYYSGHGWRQEGGSYFLIPHDVDPNRLTSSALPAEDFIQSLRRIRSQRMLVMMDTCHAEAMADAKDRVAESLPQGFAQEPLPKALIEELDTGEGRAVFLSCGEAQKSWILPGENRLSIFTHHLLEALEGSGCSPGARTVKVSSLMNHLGETVPASANRFGHEQTPVFKVAAQDFPIALIRGGKGVPIQDEGLPAPAEKPASSRTSITVGSAQADRDVIVGEDITVNN